MTRKIDGRRVVLLLALAAVLSYLVTMLAFYFVYTSSVYETRELGMDVYVFKTAGLNVDDDAIHFGKIPPGASGRRNITIDNDAVPNLVSLEAYGDIAEWVSVSHNDFIIDAHESRNVTVFLQVPEDAEVPGYRSGTLRIIFRKV
ncbi:MAG: hypothetical protein JXC85_02655 [Candidatus Aenigmarchaeota archaeon]|nr:hypothetical protein [Candidatus Aenigmarchaeota archaeon]